MSLKKKQLATPDLRPWVPPGREGTKKSFNTNAYKKNEGSYDLGSSIASSTVFKQPNKKSVSLSNSFFSPKKNSRKLTLGPDKERRIESLLNNSANSDVEREYLRSRILEIFDENDNHEPGKKDSVVSGRSTKMDAIVEEENLTKSIPKSKSESDLSRHVQESDSEEKNGDEGFQEDGAFNVRRDVTTVENKKTFVNSGTVTSPRSHSSGIGSTVEDLEDRRSIQFIDSYDDDVNHRISDSYNERSYDDRRQVSRKDTKATNTSSFTVVEGGGGGGGGGQRHSRTWYHTMPHNRQSLASTALPGQFQAYHHANFVSEDEDRQFHSLPAAQAWVVFPKDSVGGDISIAEQTPRFTARPLNFASSIGSKLKSSFTNISRVPPQSVTPVQAFLASDEAQLVVGSPTKEDDKSDLEKRKRGAWIVGGIVAAIAVIILVIVGLAIALSSTNLSGSQSSSQVQTGGAYFPSAMDNSTAPCRKYTVLDEKWRKIVGVRPQSSGWNCDYPSNRNKGIRPGWHRFEGDAGTHLPTEPPSNMLSSSGVAYSPDNVCGTQKVAWMEGSHPKVQDGIVVKKFCFQWLNGDCEHHFEGKVRTCPDPNDSGQSFYVYYLKYPRNAACNYGFCAYDG